MTIQSHYLLHKMKSVQNSPNSTVSVDSFSGVLETANVSRDDRKSVSLSRKFTYQHLDLCLKELESAGCIEADDFLDGLDSYIINPQGQYIFQHILGSLFYFLAGSIVTPILVSVLTTFITLKLFGQI